MSDRSFRKGVSIMPGTAKIEGNSPGIATFDSSNKRIGRAVTRVQEPEPPPRVRGERRVITASSETPQEPPPRRGLVDAQGYGIGLQQATIQGRAEQSEAANEQCNRCGKWWASADMRTLVANVENTNNPLRMCAKCAEQCYKDPKTTKKEEGWRPSVPAIRFTRGSADDKKAGRPYDARRAGVTVGDLITKDTHYDMVTDRAALAEVRGEWSGSRQRVGRTLGVRR